MAAVDNVNEQQFGTNQIKAGFQSLRGAGRWLEMAGQKRREGNVSGAHILLRAARDERSIGESLLRKFPRP